MQQILETVRAFDGVLELAPTPGGPYPEIAWGDYFFYYAPDGQVPQRQPYATIVTKDYPDDDLCNLNDPGRWRLNIHVGKSELTELTGADARGENTGTDFGLTDTVLPHPLYRAQGWIAITNPSEKTHALAVRLLRQVHDDAKRRALRRRG